MTKNKIPNQSRMMIAHNEGMLAVIADHSKRGAISKFKEPLSIQIQEMNNDQRSGPTTCDPLTPQSKHIFNADIPK
jgi:hypothetical protein